MSHSNPFMNENKGYLFLEPLHYLEYTFRNQTKPDNILHFPCLAMPKRKEADGFFEGATLSVLQAACVLIGHCPFVRERFATGTRKATRAQAIALLRAHKNKAELPDTFPWDSKTPDKPLCSSFTESTMVKARQLVEQLERGDEAYQPPAKRPRIPLKLSEAFRTAAEFKVNGAPSQDTEAWQALMAAPGTMAIFQVGNCRFVVNDDPKFGDGDPRLERVADGVFAFVQSA